MKLSLLILSIVIPGHKGLGNDIDVYTTFNRGVEIVMEGYPCI